MTQRQSINRFNKIFLTSILLLSKGIASHAMNMEDYVSKVFEKNQAVESSRTALRGGLLTSNEAKLIYSPRLGLSYDWQDDQLPSPLFTLLSRTKSSVYRAGIEQQTPWGLKLGASYILKQMTYQNIRPTFFEAQPRFDVSLNLLRNRLGSETERQFQLTKAQNKSALYAQAFQLKLERLKAETAYIRLSATRSLKDLNKQALTRAKDIYDWLRSKASLGLTDSSDLIQAEANLESRSLALLQSTQQERQATQSFASLLESELNDSNSSLDWISRTPLEEPVLPTSIPEYSGDREDLQAALASQEVAEAQALLAKERNKPVLEIFGSYALNSRENSASDAFSQSFDSRYPYRSFGIRFQTPLSIGTTRDTLDGYDQQARAQNILSERKRYENKNEWIDLKKQFDEAKERINRYQNLVAIQRKKMERERIRLKNGRTTTYQALLFEVDYIQAEASRIQALAEIQELHSRLKTYSTVQY